MKSIIVLSLFDGAACGLEALKRAGIPVKAYYASEIDKHAIKVAKKNHPEIIHLGDVRRSWAWNLPKIDLLIAGSPCQGFSFAGNQLAFRDARSKLFFKFVGIKRRLQKENPDLWFYLENVKMKKSHEVVISRLLGVDPLEMNSALVSAQNRVRLYWANWQLTYPEDRGILLRDIIDNGDVDRKQSYCIDANYYKGGSLENYLEKSRRQVVMGARVVGRKIDENGKRRDYSDLPINQRLELRNDEKSGCITSVTKDSVVAISKLEQRIIDKCVKDENGKANTLLASSSRSLGGNGCTAIKFRKKSKTVHSSGLGSYDRHEWDSISDCHYRKLTVNECEYLQTLKKDYTAGVSNTRRYQILGNGWTVEMVAHHFSTLGQPLDPASMGRLF